MNTEEKRTKLHLRETVGCIKQVYDIVQLVMPGGLMVICGTQEQGTWWPTKDYVNFSSKNCTTKLKLVAASFRPPEV